MNKHVLCLCAALVAAPIEARAQSLPSRPEFGVQVAAALSGGNNFAIGGRIRYPFSLTAPAPINAIADVNLFLGNTTVADINWNLVYNFVPHSEFRPYAGGGVNLSTGGGNTRFGANAVGGFDLGHVGRLAPYLEGRYTFFSLDSFIITFGVRF